MKSGPWAALCDRFARRRKAGMRGRFFLMLHQRPASAASQCPTSRACVSVGTSPPPEDGGDGGMGRSRGGLTPKILAPIDAAGRPIRLTPTAGRAGVGPVALGLMQELAKGATLIADRACGPDAIRGPAATRGAWADSPSRVIRRDSFGVSGRVYRRRNLVERVFDRLKPFRGLAPRRDRSPKTFIAAATRAAARIRLASNESAP
ncbi:MAG: IS5/IS1182 family transposase [Pseudomonadota bacterium]